MEEATNLKKVLFVLALSAVALCRISTGVVIYVDDDGPADFNNIQAAIFAAFYSDTVLVADGTYKGVGNKNIDFTGKAITVQSKNGPDNCIVDCEGSGRGFYFHTGETTKSILNGFTVTNGNGILCDQSSPTITNCIITKNSVGIYVMNYSSPIITNSIISENSGTSGGMYCHSYCNPTILNCVIIGNSVYTNGAGLRFGFDTSFTITNCTITGNSAGTEGGGVVYDKPGTITNSIIWGNTEPQVSAWYPRSPAVIDVSYSDIEGGYPGTGNMNIDPLLLSDGYHIQSNSPCLNSGDPIYSPLPGETDIDGEARVINNQVDIGADEINYEGPIITILPRHFNIFYGIGSQNPEPLTLQINNSGEGIINWIVTDNCDWLEAWPTSGKSSGDVNEVTLTVDAQILDVGKYNCELMVSDPNVINTPQYVTVNLEVRKPVIAINPTVCNFVCALGGPNPETQTLSVWNDDIGVLNWQISEECNWLDINPCSGRSTGEVNEVIISVDADGLDGGEYSCLLEISDPNASNSPQEVTVNLDVRPPVIGITPAEYDFIYSAGDPNPEPRILSIWNDDIGTLNWNLTADCNWLEVAPKSGSCSLEVNEVDLSIDGSSLLLGTYDCNLTISDPTALNNPQNVSVRLYICGETVYVPVDFSTIQDAIDYTLEGGTVIVSKGTYTGPGNRDIDFKGKAITVRCVDPNDPNIVASTIIDCNGTETEPHRGFYFHSEEDKNSILDGFTITNGYGPEEDIYDNGYLFSVGGAIFCYDSTPTIMNCNITGNTASESGGGIYCKLTLPPLPPPPIPPPVQDCNATGPTIANCKITGNTASGYGGGIYYENSGPIILNCTITGNTAEFGGGIFSMGELPTPPPPPPLPPLPGEAAEEQSSAEDLIEFTSNLPTISHCIITNNIANTIGGGISNFLKTQQIITHCIISENIAGLEGGGIFNADNKPTINNCVISYNRTDQSTGGIFNLNAEATINNCTIFNNSNGAICNVNGSDPVFINNCILWGNEREIVLLANYYLFYPFGVSKATVSHCDIMGGEMGVFVGMDCTLNWGQGNIDLDPCLANPGYWTDKNDPNIIVEPDDPNAVLVVDDYHLKSQAGRWNEGSKSWVFDDVTSPCIDAGDPNSDWKRELWPHGERVNMGAYGGTPEASMSLSGAGNTADLNFDGYVGYADANIFTDKWLYEELLLPEDLNRDGLVNFSDFSIFAYNWNPPPPLPGQAGNPDPAD